MRARASDFRRYERLAIGVIVVLFAGLAVLYSADSGRLLQVLSAATVGIATLLFGWKVGALAFALPLSRLLLHRGDPDMLESLAECVMVYATTGIARATADRLRISESKLRAVFAAMSDVVMVLDRDGRYLDIAPTVPSLLYRPAHELLGRLLSEIFDRDTAESLLGHVRRSLDSRSTVTFDYMLEIGGERKWFSGAVSPLNADSVICVARDVTGRKTAEEALQQSYALLERRVTDRTEELQQTVRALNDQVERRTIAEEALRRSEAHHRRIIDQISEIIFTLDSKGIITSLNPAFERVTGWPAADWVGRPLAEIVIPAQRQSVVTTVARAGKMGSRVSVKRATIAKPDGSHVILEGSIVAHMVDGRQEGFLGSARDITERETALEELRGSEDMLAESQRIAKLGSWEFDVDSAIEQWSDQMYELLGLDRHSTIPAFETFTEFVVPEDRGRLIDMKNAIGRGEARDLDVTVVLPDGTRKHLRINALGVTHTSGRHHVCGIVQDITQQKLAEQQLRETEERFRLLARATNDGAYDWDFMSNSVWWGEAHRTLFGYPADDEASVASWKNRVHADDRERVWASFQTALETGLDTWSDEYRYRRSDGSYAIVLDRATISRDAEMKPVRMFGAMTDMTERKHLQEQLAQAKRVSSLGRVAASIAHEFNNVLMGIQPNLEVIRRRGAEDLRSPIDHILQSVRRGKRVTDEILRFTRPGAPGLQCVGVQSFFERWSAENGPILGSNVELQFDFESDLFMTVDPLQVSQVFTNLALNARDAFGERGGRLTISASLATSFGSFSFGVVKSADRYVHFRVHDDGCGMSKEQLAHVFEPLFTTKKKGTGLGLAISYQLVLQHEGYMFVESEPGAGSTFHVFLLAGSPVLRLVEQPSSSEVAFKRILLVEDEVAVAAGIRTLLELDQVTVEAVHSGREAIPGIQRFRPDCLILDIGLPDISGTELYIQIAARWPELPVVFSSGHADAAKLEPLLRVPTTALLLKPYDFDALRAALTRLCAVRPRLQLASS